MLKLSGLGESTVIFYVPEDPVSIIKGKSAS